VSRTDAELIVVVVFVSILTLPHMVIVEPMWRRSPFPHLRTPIVS
jgi:hypothetical protein